MVNKKMESLLLLILISLATNQISAGCEVEIVTREQWGARPPRNTQLMNISVPHIFIHHTVTRNCTSLESCTGIMQGIQNYHMDKQGWDDIGYSFLIGGDGRAYTGRGWDKVGAHTYGFNRVALAFSLIGNYETYSPTDSMLEAAKNLIQCAKNQSYVTDEFKIHGHRDGVCTECPGQTLYDIIISWDRFEGGPLPGYSCKRL